MAKTKVIPEEIVIKIWKDLNDGISNAIIKKRYNISSSTLHRIKNKEKRFGKIINNYINEHQNDTQELNKKSLQSAKKVPKEKISSQTKEENILENLDKLNYEIFVSILYQSFSKYYQPVILKLIYDNFLSTEKSKKLIERTIKDIQETKNIENFYEALNTIQAIIHSQLLVPEALEKILKKK